MQLDTPEDFNGFVMIIVDLIRLAIPIVFALTLAAFLWGMAMFILNAGNDEKREQGKKLMVWGVIALFVMVSVWGIIAILTDSFGFDFMFPTLRTS